MSTMPFERVLSVRCAFDAVKKYFRDLEIRMSDRIGLITVRKDDDNYDSEIPQNRFVSTSSNGCQIESNTIFFSRFKPIGSGTGERGCGLIVADFVDSDDRYPYCPSSRVRRDLTSVLEITSCVKNSPSDTEITEEKEEIVVLTCWVHVRLHSPIRALRASEWTELRQASDGWVKLMSPATLETLV